MYKRLFDIHPWKLTTTRFDKENKRLQESLTSIGNSYMGMRGNFEETYSGDTHQGTYIAGVWFPDKTRVGWWKNGYPEYFGKVINATNFIGMTIKINDEIVDLNKIKYRDFYLELDMKTGILSRRYVVEQGETEVALNFKRFVSIATPELAVVRLTMEVLSGGANVSVTSYLDGNVTNEDSNYEEQFWLEKAVKADADDSYLTMETKENPFGTPRFSVTTLMKNYFSVAGKDSKENISLTGEKSQSMKYADETVQVQVKSGDIFFAEKRVAVINTRNVPEERHVDEARMVLADLEKYIFEELEEQHRAAWEKRWDKADIVIDGDDEAQQGIRFNIFQLFSTYYGEDARLNIGPKGFTGEKYGGATYWDTEAYIVPMYLSVAEPKVTKQLLKYRHQQLPGAKHNARQQGLKGALYPMVTFNGIECHNEWEITFEEIHRNAAVAHAIFNYSTYTGDESYLLDEGIEVLVEISRFWEDRVHFSKRHNQYMIHGVTGPNEYENNVNNNWYTNRMATWVLRYTLETLGKVSKDKLAELQVTEKEKEKWLEIIDKMYYPYDEDLEIFVQHDTFLDKDLTPVAQLDKKHLPLNQNWSWDRVLRSPYIKQADTLQAMYFLNHEFTREEKKRHFDFYEPLTVHESSLSPCVHSILAAELGMEEKAVELYARTARLDLDNYNNDTEDGLHITSMSGSWLSIVHGFAGMRTLTGKLSFAPFIPKDWQNYRFKINYRGRLLELSVSHEDVEIELLAGDSLPIEIFDEKMVLEDHLQVKLSRNEGIN